MSFILTLTLIAQSIGCTAVDVRPRAPAVGKAAPSVYQAIALLILIGVVPTVPVAVYHTKAARGNPQTANGFTDGNTIFVNDRITDPIAIAGIIAHEQFHVDHGANTEDGAYVEQLRVLKVLHADRKSVRAVEMLSCIAGNSESRNGSVLIRLSFAKTGAALLLVSIVNVSRVDFP